MTITVDIPAEEVQALQDKGLTVLDCISLALGDSRESSQTLAERRDRQLAAVRAITTFAQDHGIQPISHEELIASIHEGHAY